MVSIAIKCPLCEKVLGKTANKNGMGSMTCSVDKVRIHYEVINGTPHTSVMR